ncbi:single-stranded DNA-binding protein [Paracidovorax valerianellae]|uniref:single-stranded DNA-binding protein n=1 Tax=Paracidovorax valerianellae TaxID=187868 RepID=UPI00230241EC|nr:single-stranded DNA-binding protein [Paracidovorax valerianellae]MDA8445296.1 single-stranded DNA-binding protein [Paracidovorax valerianellae]
MNAPAASPTQGTKIGPMQVLVKGRIDATRRHEQTRYTRIVTPAPDPYSRPQTVEVRSKAQLGSKGEEVQVLAQLGGYTRKPFRSTDKETGEVTSVTPVDLTLDAVE